MDVRLPNGMIIRGIPKGTTKDQILSKLKAKGYDVDELLKPADLLEDYEPPKEEGIIAAAKQGAESLISSGRTALEALLGDEEEAAKRGLERSEDIAKRYKEGPSLERIKQIYEEQGLLPAAKEAVSEVPEAIAAQLPNLASNIAGARLGAMAGSAIAPGIGTAVGAGLGAVAPSILQQLGSGVERQAAEGATDISMARALPAAIAGGVLDIAPELAVFGKQGLRVILGKTGEKLFKEGAKDELESIASQSLAKTLAKGTAIGLVSEVPTEIGQQMLERWQAGLDLTSEDALKEYAETAYQAGLLAPIGAAGRVVERAGARGELAAREEAAKLLSLLRLRLSQLPFRPRSPHPLLLWRPRLLPKPHPSLPLPPRSRPNSVCRSKPRHLRRFRLLPLPPYKSLFLRFRLLPLPPYKSLFLRFRLPLSLPPRNRPSLACR